MDTSGLESSEWPLAEMLERVGAAHPNASQKMEILRLHVLLTGIQPLVLDGVTVGDLIATDTGCGHSLEQPLICLATLQRVSSTPR